MEEIYKLIIQDKNQKAQVQATDMEVTLDRKALEVETKDDKTLQTLFLLGTCLIQ